MKITPTQKIRAIGGASVLALTAGLAGTALAQSAPQPVGAAPTPTAPTAPANAEECAVTDGVIVCAPGTDADGFFDVSGDPLGLDVQDGAVVQSSIIVTGAVNGSVDGAIVTGFDFESGLLLGGGSDVTVNGYIETAGDNAAAIETEDGSFVTVNGTAYTTGASSSAIALAQDSSAVNTGLVQTDGDGSAAILAFGNNVSVENTVTGSIFTSGTNSAAISGADSLTVTNAGLIQTFGDQSSGVTAGDGASVTNDGNIVMLGDFLFGVNVGDDAVVVNNGLIATTGEFAVGVQTGENGSVTNNDVISTEGNNLSDAVVVGAGSTVTNNGTIAADGDDSFAVFGTGDGVTVNNAAGGLITTSGVGGFAVALAGTGSVTNDGTIATTGVGGIGIDASLAGATIVNNGSITTEGDEAFGIVAGDGSTVTNSEGASITATGEDAVRLEGTSTITNNGSITGTRGYSSQDGDQTFVNFGSLTGTSGVAALFLADNDEFQQWTGATVDGDIDLGTGDDTFILEGTASSIAGTVFGGDGTDIAIIAGTLDADNFTGFETYQLGSTLGGTLNDAVISGDRTLDGDVSLVGSLSLGLGVDSLSTTGSITLEDGSQVTISTPLDTALVGQTVNFFTADGGVTDNGAAFTIIDDDLLVDYVLVGSSAVTITAVNPLTTSADPNVVTLGGALGTALATGNLTQANFDLLNNLPDTTTLESIALDSLPNLSEGAGREIFESSSAASHALTRHLSGEGTGVWGEIIVRGAEQDASSLTAGGYESEQLIFTVGGDIAVGETFRVGLLASYADIENDDLSGGVERGETEIESMKFGAYAGLTFMERGFLNGEIAYLTGDVDNVRTGGFGPIGSSFDFDGWAYSATAGFDLVENEAFAVTPFVGVNGASISFDDAVESGGFGFTVARDDADFLELRGGVELSGNFSEGLSGYVSGTGIKDLEDDIRVFSLSSAELGNFNVLLPEREDSRFELAAGATFDVSENLSIGLGYQGDFASGYDAHAGRASLRLAF